MENKAVFLDRDGTINVEKHYLHKIEDFEFLPGAIEALKMLQNAGFLLIIITNQSGIGRGYYQEKDFVALNDWMLNYLEENGVHISKVYFCPHHPNAKLDKYRAVCNCRKPATGLFEQAINEFSIDISKSWAIGDKLRDCAICGATACKGVLIENNETEEVLRSVKNGEMKDIFYAVSLKDAAQRILLEEDIYRTV